MHCLVLLLIDVGLVALSTLAAAVLSYGDTQPLAVIERMAPYGLFTLLAAVPILLLFRLNRTVWRFSTLSDCAPLLAASVLIGTTAATLDLLIERTPDVPRALPVMQVLLILYSLGGTRIAMRIRHARRRQAREIRSRASADRENVLLVGLNPIADLFLSCVSESVSDRLRIVGILSDAERHRGRMLRGCKILGPPESVEKALFELSVHGVFVDRIVVALPSPALSIKAQRALSDLTNSGKVRIDHLSQQFALNVMDVDRADGRQRNASSGNIGLPPKSYLRCKRLLDASVAFVCAIAFTPLMTAVYIVVLLDIGAPAIFWQQRPGAEGRPIKILKFRTMRSARDRNGRALTDAERVSKVGGLLRRFRLDELPQVFNVLLGHMSLVGPRPLLPVDQPAASTARLGLRPGVTGWAQIKGGRHLSIEDKAALDLWYIRNASLALDLRILLHTVRMVLFGERVDRDAIRDAHEVLASGDTSGRRPA